MVSRVGLDLGISLYPSPEMQTLRRSLAASALVAASLTSTGCATIWTEFTTSLDANPLALQRGLTTPIPAEMQALGQQYDQQMLSEGKLIQDSANERRVIRIVERLLRFCHKPGFQLTIRIVNDDTLNAGAIPGFIYVNTGLLKAVRSDDELAGILAHELAHIDAGHTKRGITSSLWTSLILAGASAITKGETADDIIQKTAAIVQPMYSREHEREADILGTIYAYRAGYNPKRLTEFFEKAWQEEEKTRLEVENQLRQTYNRMEGVCHVAQQYNQLHTQYNTQQTYADAVNAYNNCVRAQQEYEAMKVAYQQYMQQLSPLFRSHPVSAERISMVLHLTEYLKGQRSLESLAGYPTIPQVITVLQQVEQ